MKSNCLRNILTFASLIWALSGSVALAQERARGHFIVESIQVDDSNWPGVKTNVVGFNIYNNLRTSISIFSPSHFSRLCNSKLETAKATRRPIILEAPRFGTYSSFGESRWLTQSSVSFSFYNDGYRICDFSDTPSGSMARGQFKVSLSDWETSRSSGALVMRGTNVHNNKPIYAYFTGHGSDLVKCFYIFSLAKTSGRTVTINAFVDYNPWGSTPTKDYFALALYGMSERVVCSLEP